MNSRWWLRIYVAIYGLLVASIFSLVIPSCPLVYRSSRFDVALGIGCGIEGGRSFNLTAHMASWLVHAGAVAAVGLLVALAIRRRPTRASFSVWFSAGIAEWWYPLVPYHGVSEEFRAWIIPVETLWPWMMGLIAVTMALAIPAGLSLSDPRERTRVVQHEFV